MTPAQVKLLGPQYSYLTHEKGPRLLLSFLTMLGVTEKQGSGNNPVILSWARELDLHSYNSDAIPWCGLAMAYAVHRAGYEPVDNALWARNWATWGNTVLYRTTVIDYSNVSLADVLVFERGKSSGHVGIYVGEDAKTYHVLGGNQSDMVCIKRLEKSRLIAARRSPFRIGQPANVRPVFLDENGPISKNEQ